MNTPLLQVEHLEVALAQTSRALLHDVSFSLAPHRCLGVIGESGSGKSLLCRALLGLLNTAFVCRGTLRFADDEPLGFHDAALRRYRGRDISLIPQHPMTAFDPLQPIGKQMVETLCAHLALRPREAKEKAIALLQQVRLENAAKRFDDYPAQLSGGMLQRVTIAIALGLAPRLLIADEPTSALDAVTQAEIVQLFAELRSRNAMTLLFVSHDLGAIQRLADSVMVMHQGRRVEQGETHAVLNHPHHAHTRYLVEARDLSQRYQLRATGEWQAALQSVSFNIARGECVGIVGASGSGKSTLGRVLLGLERPERGEVILAGASLYETSGLWRRGIGNGGRVGAVFQDYASSVNPLMSITDIVAEPLRLQRRLGRTLARERAVALLHQVGLDDALGTRYPHQLSGGQMQRVCIARAIACEPELVVLDEAVSALDVAVQRQILDLLAELRQRLGLTYLFISHDLTAVTYLCQRVLFLHQGRIIEQVNDMAALGQVQHPAARRLLTSVMAF